jgi:hypothetical protein
VTAFQDAVAKATEGTPYLVRETKGGFDVTLDMVDARWWDLYGREGLKSCYRWRVKERRSHYTITDRRVAVNWASGIPRLNFSVQIQAGRIPSLSRQRIWALSDRGRIEPVVAYQFNSREGRDLIRLAAKQVGLKERLPASLIMPLIVASLTPAFFAIYGLITLIRHLTGH